MLKSIVVTFNFIVMPELPEVETIRLELQDEIVGKEIKSVDVLSKKQFFGNPKTLTGKKIKKVDRTGKIINILLNDGTFINIHLKLTGQILFAPDMSHAVFKNIIPFTATNQMPCKTTRIIVYFKDGSGFFFNDLRKFAWMKINTHPEGPKSIDVLSSDFTLDYFQKTVASSKKPIKILLMDQEKMAGIGNIYANEALFIARINPERRANSLNENEIKNLHEAIKQVIREGIKYKGSSAADEAYITPKGKKGEMQNHFRVYQKEGQKCPKGCGGTIKRIKQGGRSSFFCPNCQS